MKELKSDLMTGELVIYAQDRANRPRDNQKEYISESTTQKWVKECPFCKGNEDETCHETFKIEGETGWVARSVYNKYPMVDTQSQDIYGKHEVIVDVCDHNKNFYNMTELEFYNLLKVCKNRYNELIKDEKVKYVSIFKNFMRNSGASLDHPHSQIISLSILPPEIKKELYISKKYYEKRKTNMYEDMIKKEIKYQKRIINNTDNFITISPEGVKYGGEIRIFFKNKEETRSLQSETLMELAKVLQKLFKQIYNKKGCLPFNIYLHTPPKEDIHSHEYFNTHIHIVPRKYNFGGFELSTGIYVSSISPENEAEILKFE